MIRNRRSVICVGLLMLFGAAFQSITIAQEAQSDSEFGPVVSAYLGYLRGEQEVVDDRASRHEISNQYYRRNSNRIRALRQIAMNIARETNNDYLPELEAATRDEFKTLFDKPPNPRNFRVGQVVNNTFRYLGTVRTGETFYLFARLDPYEQAELIEKERQAQQSAGSQSISTTPATSSPKGAAHPRRNEAGSP